MKTAFSLAVLVVLIVAPGRCFALTQHTPVSKERAKEMGIEVRSTEAGADQVRVELEFTAEGLLKEDRAAQFNFSRVDLRLGERDNPSLTAPLQEDRSNPGRVVVRFNADRGQLDKINLWVYVPGSGGTTIYQLRVKDFVELKKDR
jgi:hypothetical protein